jgi:hypothetical protein
MATTQVVKQYNQAFELDPDTLSAIWGVITDSKQRDGEPEERKPYVSFECSDGSTIDDDNLVTLLSFPNVRARHIVSITLRTEFYNTEPDVQVTVSARRAGNPRIEFKVSGDDKNVVHAKSKLEELVSNTRLWYSPLACISAGTEGGLAALTFFGGIMFALASQYAFFTQRSVGAGIGASIISVVFFLFSFTGMRLLRWFFPPAVFAIGYGSQVADRAAKRRHFFGVVVLVGGALSIVTSLLANWLSK